MARGVCGSPSPSDATPSPRRPPSLQVPVAVPGVEGPGAAGTASITAGTSTRQDVPAGPR